MLRAAVVGLGWWGRQLTRSLRDSDRLRVVLGVDVNPQTCRSFAETFELPVTEHYAEALRDPDLDAVILTTPNALHEAQVLAAAAASKQVFCEKPLALNAAGAERMLAACDHHGIVLGIGHERRFEGALREIKRMLDAGELGTLLHVEINGSYNLFAGTADAGWRLDPAHAPGGTLTALGVHMTDYMQTIAGPVASVYARMSHRSADFPSEDIISIQFAFESGVTGYLCSIATTPFYQRWSVFGDRGWVESRETGNVDDPAPTCLTWRGVDGEIHGRTYRKTETWTQNLHAWVDAIEGRADYPFTRAEKLHNVQILEAILASVASGEARDVG